ncbi:uncharacterized protein vrs isoform X1 [Drosophila bipectinata]|uniref:uncharacterized protein vrs isoform X1 n=1 Tax=Drosophila bipectinata TaxID=42026 RepID=UPI001C8A8783|nr:uncharacterized protein LOC108129684 isoform X1 [Drosophila bipectinata]
MDIFNIPKKVNRHVFKAICFLQGSKKEFVSTGAIAKQVKIQMAKTRVKPVRNFDKTIHESLNNLASMGLVSKSGGINAYSVAFSLTQPRVCASKGRAVPKAVPSVPGNTASREKVNILQRRRSFTRMDPDNATTKLITPDSLSGNEQEKARKIFRTTKRLVKEKKVVPPPKRAYKKKPGRGFKPKKLALKAKDKTQYYQQVVCMECSPCVDSNIDPEVEFIPNTSQDVDHYMDVDQNDEEDVYDDKNSQTTSRPFVLGTFNQMPNGLSMEDNLEQKSSGHELKSVDAAADLHQSSACSMVSLKEMDSCMQIWYPDQMSMAAPVETPSFTSVGNINSTSQTSVAQGAQDSVGDKSNSPRTLESNRTNPRVAPTFFNPEFLDVHYMRQMLSSVGTNHSYPTQSTQEPGLNLLAESLHCQDSRASFGVKSSESGQEPGLNPVTESLHGQDSRASFGVKSSESAQEPGLNPLAESLHGQDAPTSFEAKSESAQEPSTSKSAFGSVTPQSSKSNYDFYN